MFFEVLINIILKFLSFVLGCVSVHMKSGSKHVVFSSLVIGFIMQILP
jgi:hypothetical protein